MPPTRSARNRPLYNRTWLLQNSAGGSTDRIRVLRTRLKVSASEMTRLHKPGTGFCNSYYDILNLQ